jgi:hypothetical protein
MRMGKGKGQSRLRTRNKVQASSRTSKHHIVGGDKVRGEEGRKGGRKARVGIARRDYGAAKVSGRRSSTLTHKP